MGAHDVREPSILRIMTFNTWCSGDRVKEGRDKIVKHILAVNPDVVALQEVYNSSVIEEFVKKLGEPWKAYFGKCEYVDNALLTKHEILLENGETFGDITWYEKYYNRNSSIGTTIKLLNGRKVVVWSMHTDYVFYGPYAMREQANVTDQTIYEREARDSTRVREVEDLKKNEFFQRSLQNEHVPVFICGDFNAPSHLDYVEETKHLHYNWTFEWPTSKLLTDIGFFDSYRQIYSDPVAHPGNTWSPVIKLYESTTEPEPQDRIDFVYYKGSNVQCIESKLYAGHEKIEVYPNHETNDWPSDHYSVVSDFVIGPYN